MTPGTGRPPAKHRHDGWTPARRAAFLDHLAVRPDVRRACGSVGLSRQSAYRLRRRDGAFAAAWDGALERARRAERQAFAAALPEFLRRTLSHPSQV